MTLPPRNSSQPTIGASSTIGARGLLTLALFLAISSGLGMLVDLPVARAITKQRPSEQAPPEQRLDDRPEDVAAEPTRPRRTRQLPGDLVRIVNLAEVFGYSPTAGIILLSAFLLDTSLVRRKGETSGTEKMAQGRTAGLGGAWCLPASLSTDGLRMVAISFSGGLTTDLIKLIVTRVRPYAADLAMHASAVDTFSNIEGVGGTAMRSFPSGHAAVAAGLASALSWRYPRGAPLFIIIAIAAAAQRLISGSHYVSDVAAGAAIAVAWAAFWLRTAKPSNPA